MMTHVVTQDAVEEQFGTMSASEPINSSASFDKRLDRGQSRVGANGQPVREGRKTLRLEKHVEDDISNLNKKYNEKGQLMTASSTGFLNKVGNAVGFNGGAKKQKVIDVQGQIEKYVENLCQIYSKGTGGRADSVLECE